MFSRVLRWPSIVLVAGLWLAPLDAQDDNKGDIPEIEARLVLYLKDHASCRVAITADNKTIVSACQAFGGVRFWDVDKKAERPREPAHTGRGVFGLALSPDGKTVASGGRDGKIFLWDVSTGKTRKELGEHKERVISAHFTQDGKKLFTASFEGDIKVWDVAGEKEVGALFGRTQNIGQVDLSTDGKVLALFTGTQRAVVTLWDVDKDKRLLALESLPHNQGLGPIRLSPDGKHVAVVWGNTEPKIGFWDTATGKPAGSINLHQGGNTHELVFSPDSKRVAASHGSEIRLWDIATGKPVAAFVGHTATVEALAFSPDGKTLVSGSRDHRIRLWDVPSASRRGPNDKQQ